MGNFSAENDYPGVPLEPRVFEQVENFEANWVEIEFQTLKGSSLMAHRFSIICIKGKLLTYPNTGLQDCYDICAQVLKKANS
jgi:hypothetical protein